MLDNKYREPVPPTMPKESRQIPSNNKISNDILGVFINKPIADMTLTDDEAVVLEHVLQFQGKIVREIAFSLDMDQERVRTALRGLRNKRRVSPGIVYAYYPYVSGRDQ